MITLNTIIYEGNYNDFLNHNCWFFTIESNYITKKQITVNNLTSFDLFNQKVKELKETYDFDVIFVSEYEEITKDFFKLNLSPSDVGYYYTFPYFVSLYNTTTKYFFNVASDCMNIINLNEDYFKLSLEELDKNDTCLTTTINWDPNPSVPEAEEVDTIIKLGLNFNKSKNFYYRYGFSDQFFLGNTERLKLSNWNVDEKMSSRYYFGPSYCGNCFEKIMVGIHIESNLYSLVYKKNNYYYLHR